MTYVVFNKRNGDILSLSNLEPSKDMYPDLEWGYFDEEIIHVLDILEGKRQSSSYTCAYDISKERWFLREKSEFDAKSLPIAELIYHIPKHVVSEDYDILQFTQTHDIIVVKDYISTCYKFLIGSKLERQLRSEDSFHGIHLAYSLTEFNNPNILYRMITVDLEQLVRNHYQIFDMKNINEETNPNIPISVFTNKRYDNYIFFEVV